MGIFGDIANWIGNTTGATNTAAAASPAAGQVFHAGPSGAKTALGAANLVTGRDPGVTAGAAKLMVAPFGQGPRDAVAQGMAPITNAQPGAAGGAPQPGPQQPQYQDPSQAYSFPALNGADIRQPGAIEQAFAQHGSQYWDPSLSHGYAQNILSQYGNGTNLPQNPGLSAYYDDAERRASDKARSASAATGTYGSSYGQQQQNDLYSGMEADRAKHEAQYALDRDAATRGWAQTLSGIAGSADNTDVNRWNSGFNAAGAAQAAQNNRFQTNFNDSLQMGDRLAGIIGHANDRAHDDWWHAFDTSQAGDLAGGKQGIANATYNGQQSRQNFNDTVNTAANGYKAGSSIQQSFNQPTIPSVPYQQPTYNYQPGYYQTGPTTDTYNMPVEQM